MNKTILVYRYNSICEPAAIRSMKALGYNVIEITNKMTNKRITPQQCINLLKEQLLSNKIDAIFSINFFPVVSEVSKIFKIPYICITVDCPILELYSDSIKNEWNRIFMFDFAQYEEFAPKNPNCIFYLPLAADMEHYDQVISTITKADNKFKSDISFVGSLYSEKSPYNKVKNLPAYTKGYLDGIIEAQLNIYGCNILPGLITQEIVDEYKKHEAFYLFPEKSEKNEIAVLAHTVLGYRVAELERIRMLNALAEHFNVDLYTGSDTTPLKNVNCKGLARSLTEMPKIFNLSKINLNFTVKPIQTGLPLRIWDIMGCGGFVLSNYQQEIPEYFEIGKEIEIFGSKDELIKKANYYLSHEDERAEIAKNGYNKVKEMHTWMHRVETMMKVVG